MTIQTVEQNNIVCAVINSDKKVFTDAQSALDVLMTAKYDAGTKNIVIDKKLIVEDFFILGTGLAGEILQKYTNYGGRIAFMAITLAIPANLSKILSMRAIRARVCFLFPPRKKQSKC